MLETLKLLCKAKPKLLAFLVFLIVSFQIVHFFSQWQLDMIVCPPVWSSGWSHPIGRYADEPFQCWIWHTTMGEAYDTLFFLNFASHYGTIIVFIILLYWIISQMRKMGKINVN